MGKEVSFRIMTKASTVKFLTLSFATGIMMGVGLGIGAMAAQELQNKYQERSDEKEKA